MYNRCSSHGQCRVSLDAQWECRCYDGWDGPDCAVPLEQNCADNKDNDKGMRNRVTLKPGVFVQTLSRLLQMVWWTAKIPNAVWTRLVGRVSCAFRHQNLSTSCWGSNHQQSRLRSLSEWSSSSTRAVCKTMLALKHSTKGKCLRKKWRYFEYLQRTIEQFKQWWWYYYTYLPDDK